MTIKAGYIVQNKSSMDWSTGYGDAYNEIQHAQMDAVHKPTDMINFISVKASMPNNPGKEQTVGLFADNHNDLLALFGRSAKTGTNREHGRIASEIMRDPASFKIAADFVTQRAPQPVTPKTFLNNPSAYPFVIVEVK